jgi:hypothetical protein
MSRFLCRGSLVPRIAEMQRRRPAHLLSAAAPNAIYHVAVAVRLAADTAKPIPPSMLFDLDAPDALPMTMTDATITVDAFSAAPRPRRSDDDTPYDEATVENAMPGEVFSESFIDDLTAVAAGFGADGVSGRGPSSGADTAAIFMDAPQDGLDRISGSGDVITDDEAQQTTDGEALLRAAAAEAEAAADTALSTMMDEALDGSYNAPVAATVDAVSANETGERIEDVRNDDNVGVDSATAPTSGAIVDDDDDETRGIVAEARMRAAQQRRAAMLQQEGDAAAAREGSDGNVAVAAGTAAAAATRALEASLIESDLVGTNLQASPRKRRVV